MPLTSLASHAAMSAPLPTARQSRRCATASRRWWSCAHLAWAKLSARAVHFGGTRDLEHCTAVTADGEDPVFVTHYDPLHPAQSGRVRELRLSDFAEIKHQEGQPVDNTCQSDEDDEVYTRIYTCL